MSFATGARSGFSYVVETTFGTTPNTPSMQDLPVTGHRLNLEKQMVQSAQIRTDRQGAILRHGQRGISGTIDTDFAAGHFDQLLEGVMMSAFSGGVLDIGTSLRSFTFEDRMSDAGLYRKFTGCVLDRMSLRAQPNSMIGLNFNIIGRDQTSDMATPLDTGYGPIGMFEPFDSYRIVLTEGGDTIAKVSALSLSLDNNMDPATILGTNTTPQILLGRAKIGGEITVYVDNSTLLQKFIDETETSLSLQMDDGVTQYSFLLPRIKYAGASLSLEDDKARLLTLPFEASRDETTGTSLRITKVTL